MLVYLSLTSVAFLWGTSFAVSKIGLYELSPLNMAGLRFILASLLFSCILLFRKNDRHIDIRDVPQLIIMSFLSITSYFYIQYTGLLYTTSINAALLLATSPLLTTIASVLTRQEKVNTKAICGIILAFAGVTLVISRGKIFSLFASETLFGDLLILLNASVWAIYTLYGKRILQKYSPLTAVAYIYILGTLMLLPAIVIPSNINPVTAIDQFSHLSLKTLLAGTYLAALCSVYGYYMWYRGVSAIGAVRTSSFYYISPLFALLAGVFLLDESITHYVILGGFMVIAGVYVTNKNKTTFSKN